MWRQELRRGYQVILTTTVLLSRSLHVRKMSNYGFESSVAIDQDFFDSGYSYGEQKEQQFGVYDGSQQYSDYGHVPQTEPAFNYSSTTPQGQGFYDPYDYRSSLPYDYGASGPTALSSSGTGEYGLAGSMRPRQTSEDYTSFEDEPPLLEGKLHNVARGNLICH